MYSGNVSRDEAEETFSRRLVARRPWPGIFIKGSKSVKRETVRTAGCRSKVASLLRWHPAFDGLPTVEMSLFLPSREVTGTEGRENASTIRNAERDIKERFINDATNRENLYLGKQDCCREN